MVLLRRWRRAHVLPCFTAAACREESGRTKQHQRDEPRDPILPEQHDRPPFRHGRRAATGAGLFKRAWKAGSLFRLEKSGFLSSSTVPRPFATAVSSQRTASGRRSRRTAAVA